MQIRASLAASLALCATAAQALTPLPPCEIDEGGMRVGDIRPLGSDGSGVVVEQYSNVTRLEGNVYVPQPGPVAALNNFFGVRVTHCASGTLLVIPNQFEVGEVVAALGATEYLRPALQAKRPMSAANLKDAVRAVYGKAVVLRENEETCACSIMFPDLRPKGMVPFADRRDVN